MTKLLMWEKPKKVMTKEEHESYSADGAPPGTYVPNMSKEDVARWKAKWVGRSLGFPQVEIRKDSFVIIISLRGYKYKSYDTRQTPENLKKWAEYARSRSPKPGKYYVGRYVNVDDFVTVHMATSGAIQFSFKQLDEFMAVIEEAKQELFKAAMEDSLQKEKEESK